MKKNILLYGIIAIFGINADQVSYGYFDVMLTDIHAYPKSITIPYTRTQSIIEQGMYVDGSSIAGLESINTSDVLVKPDTNALYDVPWLLEDKKTKVMIADVYNEDGSLYQDSPRTVLKNVVQHAHDAGYQPYFGVELEFYIVRPDAVGALVPCDEYGYCDAIPHAQIRLFELALLESLQMVGIEIDKIHHEVSPGQYEIVLKYTDPIKAADNLIMARYIIETAAHGRNLKAIFMPKPFAHLSGSGMHVHMSLFETVLGTNALYDRYSKHHLSSTAHYFIGGMMTHLQEIELLLNSSINSYKRLVHHNEAPVYICWGHKNRSAAFRIPEVTEKNLHDTHGTPMRVECRILDGSCNPYLAFAALLEAGLDGIAKKQKAPSAVEDNVYYYTEEEIEEKGIETLATSLGQAIDIFKESEFSKQLLGTTLWGKILDIKEKEWNSYTKNEKNNVHSITAWEKNYHRVPGLK